MTGAAWLTGAGPSGEFTLGLRALNGKGLSVKLRLPSDAQAWEREIERRVRACLDRGTVSVLLTRQRTAPDLEGVIDESRFAQAAERLVELASRSGLAAVTARDVLGVPGVVNSAASEVPAQLPDEVAELLQRALDALLADREAEGRETAASMLATLDEMDGVRRRVAERAPTVVEEHRTKLLERINEFLAQRGIELDASDVVREVGLYADRVDIAEELQRLETHVNRVRETFAGGGVIGRRLEFLLQEVLREVNTIGSKTPHAEMAHDVVAMKSAVDRLKEQAANLE